MIKLRKIEARAGESSKAEILIYEPIGGNFFGDGTTAKNFAADLAALGPVSQITVRINSPGGEVFDGVGIYNALKRHDAEIVVDIDGIAASIASLIAMAGDKIIMHPGTMMMVHNPFTLAMGDANDMRQSADMLDQIAASMSDIYTSRTGKKRSEITAIMDAETWFTPAEAVANGFADEVTDPSIIDAPAIAASGVDSIAGLAPVAAGGRDFVPLVAARFTLTEAKASFSAFATSFRASSADILAALSASQTSQSVSADAIGATMTPEQIEASVKADVAQKVAAALAAEKTRKADIRTRFGTFAAAHRTLLDECVDDSECTVDAAGTKLLAALAAGAGPLGSPRIEIIADGRDKFIAAAGNALLARRGIEKDDPQNELRGAGLCRIARAVLSRAGVSNPDRLEGTQLASKVFATMSTSDFPALLANTANKSLRKGFDSIATTWEQWAGKTSVKDFKANSIANLGQFASLLTVPEGSEFKEAGFVEESESLRAATKGRLLSMTRQMLINDDLGVFLDRSTRMGGAAKRTINEDVYAKLIANPTMGDTGALFNATAVTAAGGHANLTSSGTVLSVASLAAGEALMAAQKDKGLVSFLNIAPRILLIPTGLRRAAWELLNPQSTQSKTVPGTKNYGQALDLAIVADANLNSQPLSWYLLGDPNVEAVITVAFLDGNETPYTDEAVDFDTDALRMKVRLDYGVAGTSWRAGYKNNGA